MGELFEEILLPSVPENIVIFLDEIDSLLSFDFPTDDFFAQIRYYYNQRVNNPNYYRLRFCLLGVATPSELIQDKKRTPFNIGRGVELTGLTEEEAIPVLSQGLASIVEHPEQLLTEVLHWTGGQPFLTQKLCRLIVEIPFSVSPSEHISNKFAAFVRLRGSVLDFVQSQIIENWETKDQPEHLKTIRDRIIKRHSKQRDSEQRIFCLLELYERILQNAVVADNTSEEHELRHELRLSGLVVINRHSKFQVYNPIYREVFNEKWIQKELKNLPQQKYREEIQTIIQDSREKIYSIRGGILDSIFNGEKKYLESCRMELKLSIEEAEIIEINVKKPHRLYLNKLDRYEKYLKELIKELRINTIPIIWLLLRQENHIAGILFLHKSLTQSLPLEKNHHRNLKKMQNFLDLRDEDVKRIKAKIAPNLPKSRVKLASEVGIDYSELEELLDHQKWKEADDKTFEIMLKAIKKEERGYLYSLDIEKFPCTDFRTIDQLWVEYSDERFGFSIQKKVYLDCGAKPNGEYPSNEIWYEFNERVGWRVKGKLIDYSKFTYTLSAPCGHLPRWHPLRYPLLTQLAYPSILVSTSLSWFSSIARKTEICGL